MELVVFRGGVGFHIVPVSAFPVLELNTMKAKGEVGGS
jgi:hypothetical protein